MKNKDYVLKYTKGLVEIKGETNYDVSYQFGKLLKWGYKQSEKELLKKLKNEKINKYIENLIEQLKKEYPFVIEDLQGRADGAGVDLKVMLLNYCYEIQDKVGEHCSSIIVHTKNNIILAHNEDGPYNQKRTLLVKVNQGDKTYYTIADSRCLTSSTIYVSKNYIFSMNSISFSDYNLNYLPSYIILRILTECETFEELLDKLKTIPTASSLGLNLCNLKTGEMFYAEKILDECEIRKIEGVFMHTNHIVFKNLLKYKPKWFGRTNNTYQRLVIMNELLQDRKVLNEEEVLKILTYYGTCDYNSILSKMNSGYNCLTFGTYVFNFKTNESKIYIHNKNKDIIDLKI